MITEEAINELAEFIVKGFMKNPQFSKHKKHENLAVEQFRKAMSNDKEEVMISLTRFHAWMEKWKIPADASSLREFELLIAKEKEGEEVATNQEQ